MIKKISSTWLLLSLSAGPALASESIVVCEQSYQRIDTKQGEAHQFYKVELFLDTKDGLLFYDGYQYIGIIDNPGRKTYRELTELERDELSISRGRRSHKITDLQEIPGEEAPPELIKQIFGNIDPQTVEKIYTGQLMFGNAALMRRKNGTYLFQVAMEPFYDSDSEHCQLVKE